MEGFNVHWLVYEIQKEIDAATFDLTRLFNETATLIQPSSGFSHLDRVKRGAPLAVRAPSAFGFFGTGLSMGSGDCGLSGFLFKFHS